MYTPGSYIDVCLRKVFICIVSHLQGGIVADERVPVMSKVKFPISRSCISLVDRDESAMSRIL